MKKYHDYLENGIRTELDMHFRRKEESLESLNGAGEFQESMADGRDRNKAITVQKPAVALGCRGDYILLECDVTYDAGDTPTAETGLPKANDGLMVDVIDFTGVPVAVQHGGFGRWSPFETPAAQVTKAMTRGIDKQLLTIVPDNVFKYADIAAMSTAKSQTIRGSTDSRVTLYCDESAVASVTKVYLKLKPNSDGVFMIPAGAKGEKLRRNCGVGLTRQKQPTRALVI